MSWKELPTMDGTGANDGESTYQQTWKALGLIADV